MNQCISRVLLFALHIAFSSHAGVIITGTQSAGENVQIQARYYQGESHRLETFLPGKKQWTSLTVVTRQGTYSCSRSNKSCNKISSSGSVFGLLGSLSQYGEVKIRNHQQQVGKTRTIAGKKCRMSRTSMQVAFSMVGVKGTSEAEAIQCHYPLRGRYTEFCQKQARGLQQRKIVDKPALMNMQRECRLGIPIYSKISSKLGQQTSVSVFTATSVKEVNIPPATFQIPAGFRLAEQPPAQATKPSPSERSPQNKVKEKRRAPSGPIRTKNP